MEVGESVGAPPIRRHDMTVEVGGPPARDALDAVDRPGQPSCDGGDRVGVTAELDGGDDGAGEGVVVAHRPHRLGEARPHRAVGQVARRRLPGRGQHRPVARLIVRERLEAVGEGGERVVPRQGGADHQVVERRAPSGCGVAVRDRRCRLGRGDRLGDRRGGEADGGRRGPHQCPVAGGAAWVLPVVLGGGFVPRSSRAEHRAGLDADVVGR